MANDKPIMTPLRRENKGIKDDPQFSPYFPSHKWIVFHDYGHPEHLAADTFKTKREAQAYADALTNKPGEKIGGK